MITIRGMTQADLSLVDQVQRASYIKDLWDDLSIYKKILEGYGHSSFVAQKNGELLGYLFAYPSILERSDFEDGWKDLSGNEDHIYIHDICVSPEGRGAGIASLLLDALQKSAKENNFSKLAGIAVQDAESFWSKQGFQNLKPYPYHDQPGVLMSRELR